MRNADNIWIPNDIEYIRVKYMSDNFFSGGTPSTSDYRCYENGDIPWIASGKCQDCDVVDETTFITKYGLINSSTRLIKPNSTLIAMTGATCGKVGILKIKACANQSVFAYELNSRNDSRFLFYSLIAGRESILLNQLGGAQAGINGDVCKNIYVPKFDLSKQVKIANFLENKVTAIDKLIAQESLNIDNLTLYKNNYVKEKFDGIKRYKVNRISSFADLTKGPFGSDMKKELFVPKNKNTKKVYIQENCIDGNETLGDYYITNSYYNQMSRFSVKPHDILITCDGTLGKLIELTNDCEPGVISSSLLKVRIKKDGLLHEFFKLYWEFVILDDLMKETRNSALVHLPSASLIGKYKLKIPTIEDQIQFSTTVNNKVSSINNLIRLKTEKIEKLKEYKKSLIYECVTGRREV